jgi:hypothetical protein
VANPVAARSRPARDNPRMIDSSVVRTVVVVAFAAAALLCAGVAAALGGPQARGWRLAAVASAFLAVDRQFEILYVITGYARQWAVVNDWYDDRRLFQRWLVLGIGAAGAAAFVLWLRRQRPFSPGSAVSLGAVSFLVCLALARASSQHRVDAFLAAPAGLGLRWRPVLELLGIAAVALGAGLAMRGRRPRTRVSA